MVGTLHGTHPYFLRSLSLGYGCDELMESAPKGNQGDYKCSDLVPLSLCDTAAEGD
jgi:hypothetical protein